MCVCVSETIFEIQNIVNCVHRRIILYIRGQLATSGHSDAGTKKWKRKHFGDLCLMLSVLLNFIHVTFVLVREKWMRVISSSPQKKIRETVLLMHGKMESFRASALSPRSSASPAWAAGENPPVVVVQLTGAVPIEGGRCHFLQLILQVLVLPLEVDDDRV